MLVLLYNANDIILKKKISKLFRSNFLHPPEAVPRSHNAQLQVSENYSVCQIKGLFFSYITVMRHITPTTYF